MHTQHSKREGISADGCKETIKVLQEAACHFLVEFFCAGVCQCSGFVTLLRARAREVLRYSDINAWSENGYVIEWKNIRGRIVQKSVQYFKRHKRSPKKVVVRIFWQLPAKKSLGSLDFRALREGTVEMIFTRLRELTQFIDRFLLI